MNKKLVTLAVAGALSAPMFAQAQTANVTLYGSVREALVSTNTSNVGRANAVNSISSRLGFRGTESLGGGMNAFFHYEFGVSADATSNGFSGTTGTSAFVFQIRESWVGLNGGFGELKAGSGLTPWDDVMGMNHNSIVGEFNNINAIYFGNGFSSYNGCVGTAFDARYGNSISYATPNMGGAKVRTQFALLNEANSGKKCTGWDTALTGGFGPISYGLAYSAHNRFTNSATSTQLHNATNLLGTVKGSFGIIDVNLGLEQGKYESAHNSSSAKYNGTVFGVGANFGPSKIGIDYSARNNGITFGTNTFGNVGTNVNGGGKLYTLYLNHAFSKRTTGFVWLAQNKPETGNNQSQMAVALRHNF